MKANVVFLSEKPLPFWTWFVQNPRERLQSYQRDPSPSVQVENKRLTTANGGKVPRDRGDGSTM